MTSIGGFYDNEMLLWSLDSDFGVSLFGFSFLVIAVVAHALGIIGPVWVPACEVGLSLNVLIVANNAHSPRAMLCSFVRAIVILFFLGPIFQNIGSLLFVLRNGLGWRLFGHLSLLRGSVILAWVVLLQNFDPFLHQTYRDDLPVVWEIKLVILAQITKEILCYRQSLRMLSKQHLRLSGGEVGLEPTCRWQELSSSHLRQMSIFHMTNVFL